MALRAASSFCHGCSGSIWCLAVPVPSPRPVDAHVRHIFVKLHVTGRAHAAALAVRGTPRCRPVCWSWRRRRRAGRSRRDAYHGPRTRKLSPDQDAALRRSAPGRSLRTLDADFGASHETVRAVLRAPDVRPTTACGVSHETFRVAVRDHADRISPKRQDAA